MNARILKALLALTLLLPASAAAQSGLHVRVIPRVGLMAPTEWFYYEVAHLGISPFEWTEAAVERSAVLGFAAELEVPGSGVWIRGEVVRTVGGETWVTHAVLRPAFPNPPRVDRTYFLVPTTITVGSFDLAFPTRLQLPLGIQPYVAAGIGAKSYTFDVSGLEDASVPVQRPEEGINLVVNVGGGVRIDLPWRASLDLEVRDPISKYWGDTQHDVLWLAGLSWELF